DRRDRGHRAPCAHGGDQGRVAEIRAAWSLWDAGGRGEPGVVSRLAPRLLHHRGGHSGGRRPHGERRCRPRRGTGIRRRTTTTAMSGALILAITGWDTKAWDARFAARAPGRDIRLWPERAGAPAAVAHA